MKKNKGTIFSLKFLPMDIGRVVSSVTLLLFPLKKIYLSDKCKWFRGGALIAANHSSFRDPFLVGGIFWYRRTFFLAAEVLMKNKIIALLLKGMGCIKIDRNICDINAIKKTIDYLNDEKLVTVFPQGGIQNEDTEALKSGIVLMALKSKKPIIPIYISFPGIFRRGCAVIGEPIDVGSVPSMRAIGEATEKLQLAMEECKEYLNKRREGKHDNNK